ncbi:MAG: crotonase/enoyl-CoA hydratase family protein [Thiohalocapsa sp.]|jgi:DSF synthase|nr:crotonase/enoyl-CoA hydratase family protein [Thiohalocapsa sp.]MCF7992480.1 crotonase/enoyl-CoA hydratase family protein [Thiohalocapsa sp.]
MNSISNISTVSNLHPSYQQISVHTDQKHRVAWCYMHAAPRPCFSTALLSELNAWCNSVRYGGAHSGIDYHVIASAKDGIFNLGGDLDLFRTCVQSGDRDGLFAYGRQCIDALYANIISFDRPITTISLVQGEALGGGFETALSSDVVIAEKSARMGFPEVLFNLFPGMGAYSLLSRKLDPKRAERMILGGQVYSAQALYDMGLVDVLAEDGEGEMAVYDHIKRENRARNGFRAVRQVRDLADPITYEELIGILEIWVDTAMKLEKRDLRMMERLVSRQHQVGAKAA